MNALWLDALWLSLSAPGKSLLTVLSTHPAASSAVGLPDRLLAGLAGLQLASERGAKIELSLEEAAEELLSFGIACPDERDGYIRLLDAPRWRKLFGCGLS